MKHAFVDESPETVLSCLVTDTASIDLVIFRAWVNGISARECARQREPALYASIFGATPPEQLPTELQQRWRAAKQLNYQECTEEFQVCEWMTPYLSSPQQFQTQMVFNIAPEQLRGIIYEYYSFDEEVMREFLGKPLNKTARRELEDIAEQTRINHFSTRRQFDNLKRITNHVENELEGQRKGQSVRGNFVHKTILDIIEEAFMLPVELSSQYMHIIFLSANKIETFKSRLIQLDFKEWNSLAGVVMAMWGSDEDTLLDTGFMENMKVAKDTLSVKETLNQYRKLALTTFRQMVEEHQLWQTKDVLSIQGREQATRHRLACVEGCLTNVLKNMLQIGAGLQEWRELRDLFVDMHDKVLEPLHKADMSLEQVVILFQVLDKVLPNLSACKVGKRDSLGRITDLPAWAQAWHRCVEGVKMLTVTMYPSLCGRDY